MNRDVTQTQTLRFAMHGSLVLESDTVSPLSLSRAVAVALSSARSPLEISSGFCPPERQKDLYPPCLPTCFRKRDRSEWHCIEAKDQAGKRSSRLPTPSFPTL